MLLLLLPVAILLVCFIMGHVCWNIGVVQSFEPNPDHSPDAGTGLLSPTSDALQRGILLRRKNIKISGQKGAKTW